MNNIEFIDGLPYRGGQYLKFLITEWCVLGDCSQSECHHCFPVKNCIKHKLCEEKGICKLIKIPENT